MVYIIFLESKHYNKALQKWNEKPLHDRTYLNIKQHLNEAYEINQEFSDTTASEAGFTAQQANAIAQQVTKTLERNNEMRQPDPAPTVVPPPAATSQSNDTQALLLQSINMLQEQMLEMQQNIASTKKKKNNRNGNRKNVGKNNIYPTLPPVFPPQNFGQPPMQHMQQQFNTQYQQHPHMQYMNPTSLSPYNFGNFPIHSQQTNNFGNY